MPGRKPTPTHLKIVSGNPGRRPLPQNEPMPVGDLNESPEWLTESQKAGWRYVIEHAPKGLLKPLDSALLVLWVVAEDIHRQAAESLAESGSLTTPGSMGQPVPSPYLHIMASQCQIMFKAAAEMGFSPAARTRIQVVQETGPNEFSRLRDK